MMFDYVHSNQNYVNFVTYSEARNRLNVFPSSLLNEISDELVLDRIENELVYKTTNNEERPRDLDEIMRELADFDQIAVDTATETIYVGARNYLVKLSYKTSRLKLENVETDLVSWKPTDDVYQECLRSLGEKHCENFISIVSLEGTSSNSSEYNGGDGERRILTCGTYANRPQCTWRSANALNDILDTFDGIGKSPQTPDLSSTHVSMPNGDHYFATSIDYSDLGIKLDFLIDRSLGPSRQLRTDRYNSNWMNAPVFVASMTIGDYVYFFIRETAIEYMNCGQKIYSRVIRICKYDQGLENYDIWRSFEKARLNCSIPGGYKSNFTANTFNSYYHQSESEYPFEFDQIQDVYHDTKRNLIYALFTAQNNGMKGSAVCVYDVNSLEKAFNGPFKHQKSKDSIWEPYNQPLESYKCEPPSKNSNSRPRSTNTGDQRFQLKHLSVQPIDERPILVLANRRAHKLVVDSVQTKHQNNLDVLFIATEQNTILKYMSSSGPQNMACLLEEVDIFDAEQKRSDNAINNMVVLEKEVGGRELLVATSFSLVKMSLASCEMQTNYFGCLSSLDPYCVWDSRAQRCLLIFNTNESLSAARTGLDRRSAVNIAQSIKQNAFLHQHPINSCPITNIPVDGGFSAWSAWWTCTTKSGTKCKCRTRTCTQPEPRNGGKSCDESQSLEIGECEVNGGWTEWSQWSACRTQASCAEQQQPNAAHIVYTRVRTRSCTNPEPQFNGRVCVGADKQEEICTPDMVNPCAAAANAAILVSSNQWGPWGAWDECTKSCGEGFQMRRRVCNGKSCIGCNQEWRTCNSEPCKERVEDLITDWELIETNKESNQKLEKRLKFTCKYDSYLDANNLDSLELNTTVDYRVCEEDKFCRSLTSLSELGTWSNWSDWTVCKSCQDVQYRSRKCSIAGACFGHDRETRLCSCGESRSAQSGWSCWSEFGECEAARCGAQGLKKRSRRCFSDSGCFGDSEETAVCVKTTNCSHSVDFLSDKLSSLASGDYVFSLTHLIIAGAAAFLLGSFTVIGVVFIKMKSRSKTRKSSSGMLGPTSSSKRSSSSCCCCWKGSRRSSTGVTNSKLKTRHLSSSLEHNSLETDTAGTDVLNMMQCSGSSSSGGSSGGGDTTTAKYCSTGSEASSSNSASNHSKEYFTIGNRFDPAGLSSLLNDVIPDDDDDEDEDDEIDELRPPHHVVLDANNEVNVSNTLGRGGKKQQMVPTKSFNTYHHHTLGKNSNVVNSATKTTNNGVGLLSASSQNTSGLLLNNPYVNSITGNSPTGATAATNTVTRYSNYSSVHAAPNGGGSIRSLKGGGQQRTSFAFSMRTNLDQDL